MATRRKKPVQLGSQRSSHLHREKRYRERIQLTRELVDLYLNAGWCEPAFDAVQNARVWQGLIVAEDQGNITVNKYTQKHEKAVLAELDDAMTPLLDRFKFQCLVGGAKFDGIKRRRK